MMITDELRVHTPPDRLRRARWHISRRSSITRVTLIGLLIIGVSGYRLLEGMNFIDALYMTITTITTVGFGAVQPLSSAGRMFTIGLIIGGVSIAAYALGSTDGIPHASDPELLIEQVSLAQTSRRVNQSLAEV
jgi:hypothetical protein